MLNNCVNCIIPAVLPASAAELTETTKRLTFAPTLQIDIVDGTFAAPASWPYTEAGTLEAARAVCERFDVQVDIMAVDPLEMATAWVDLGAHALVIHIESVADLEPCKALCQARNVALWLAGNDTTPVEHYLPHLPDIYGVQLMGIETIGKQGQTLSPRVLDNIAALKAHAPDTPIQIDGSVNTETIVELVQAGATQFVAGSAIVQAEDPRAAYHALRDLVT